MQKELLEQRLNDFELQLAVETSNCINLFYSMRHTATEQLLLGEVRYYKTSFLNELFCQYERTAEFTNQTPKVRARSIEGAAVVQIYQDRLRSSDPYTVREIMGQIDEYRKATG